MIVHSRHLALLAMIAVGMLPVPAAQAQWYGATAQPAHFRVHLTLVRSVRAEYPFLQDRR